MVTSRWAAATREWDGIKPTIMVLPRLSQPAGLDGAGTLTATATYNGVESSGSLNYSVSTQLPFTLNGEFLDADQTEIGRAVTGNRISLIVTLVDSRLDLPVKNQLISADIGGLGKH
ncbi:MAG: hypothetical protein CM15mP74_21220 [Halieaceae bacterium]|nr:MAG: hypothetical protein CM15mP74_21220 [Halieaceae bacterium]